MKRLIPQVAVAALLMAAATAAVAQQQIIYPATGHFSGTLTNFEGAFVLFGYCTVF